LLGGAVLFARRQRYFTLKLHLRRGEGLMHLTWRPGLTGLLRVGQQAVVLEAHYEAVALPLRSCKQLVVVRFTVHHVDQTDRSGLEQRLGFLDCTLPAQLVAVRSLVAPPL